MSQATEPAQPADSAGTPWAGRHFEPVAHADDDGSAPPALAEALDRFARGEVAEDAVVDALRDVRLLVPLVASLAEAGRGARGMVVDKSADLALVTVAGPDGRPVLPVFSSVDTMRAWNPDARPVPVDAVRAALAAASERTDLIVLDPGSATTFALRRPAVWAIAQSLPWIPAWRDALVAEAFQNSISAESDVVALVLVPGDRGAKLAGPEVDVRLAVRPGLTRQGLGGLSARLQRLWAADPIITASVDSLSVTLVAAE